MEPRPTKTYLGKRLRELREARNLSQIDLSKLSGVPQQSISNLEVTANKTVDFNHLCKLADVLLVSVEEFREPRPPRAKRQRGKAKSDEV